ncbi:hypothetical protein B9Z55_011525 [Caenorhabditis nigoni]|uniref:Uncharacterized protein n=1 Tax=Caenorhabditis nigoni TaxID=1611254 RepID=A0A2G5UL10_9PELO|nr:hypothetical protein B9Z55_011525 [Caenorhabditis nigoni]
MLKKEFGGFHQVGRPNTSLCHPDYVLKKVSLFPSSWTVDMLVYMSKFRFFQDDDFEKWYGVRKKDFICRRILF